MSEARPKRGEIEGLRLKFGSLRRLANLTRQGNVLAKVTLWQWLEEHGLGRLEPYLSAFADRTVNRKDHKDQLSQFLYEVLKSLSQGHWDAPPRQGEDIPF